MAADVDTSPTTTHPRAGKVRLVRLLAVAAVGASLLGCTTSGAPLPKTGPGAPCTPQNSISVFCP
jgi:hypothetical protein